MIGARRSPDPEHFGQIAEIYRRELHVHCYRLLGSLPEAEDMVQETLLRAWQGLSAYEGRASIRSWLYRIATNTCLNLLAGRTRRRLPEAEPRLARPSRGRLAAEVSWLDPYPTSFEARLADAAPGPDEHYEQHESIELAFVAALQYLPPSQRAALLLRDVLGWRAAEAADILGTSTAAVNSALQRARATIAIAFPKGRPSHRPPTEPGLEPLLGRYVRAWEERDLDALLALLTDDAVLSMPPTRDWYRGYPQIRGFFEWAWGPDGPGPFRLLSSQGNGQPAFGLYGGGQTDDYKAMALQVLTLEGDRIKVLTGFVEPRLFPAFGLPLVLGVK